MMPTAVERVMYGQRGETVESGQAVVRQDDVRLLIAERLQKLVFALDA